VNVEPTSPVHVKSDTALGVGGGGVPPDELPLEDPPLEPLELEDDPLDELPPLELVGCVLGSSLPPFDFLLSLQAGNVASINSERSAINSDFPFFEL